MAREIGRVALRPSLSFVDGDTPDELFLERLFRFVEQRLQRPRSRLVRVARFADFAQGVKGGFELAVFPAVAVEFQPLFGGCRVFLGGDGHCGMYLVQRRGGRPFLRDGAFPPAFGGAFQRYLAAFDGQHPLGGGAVQFYVNDAGEQVGFVKVQPDIAGFVLGQDVEPGQRVRQTLPAAVGDLFGAKGYYFLAGNLQRVLRVYSERVVGPVGVGNGAYRSPVFGYDL